MAYLNEFPHTEASKLNLDWILEQYSTFNERLAEIVQHFDESVAQMESDILQFKGEYETAFNNYKSDINHLLEDFEQQFENLENHIEEYVSENMERWQLEAMTPETGGVIIGDYDPEEVSTGKNITTLIVNNKEMLLGNNIMTVYNVSKQATQMGTDTTSFGMKWATYNVALKLSDFLTPEVIEKLKTIIGGESSLDSCDIYIRRISSYNDTFEGLVPIVNNSFMDRDTTTFSDSKITVNFTLYDLQGLATTPSSAPYVLLDFAILKRHVL